jgi:hypothetical protein
MSSHSGAYYHDLQAGQFILPGGTANSANPIPDIWRGVWTPTDYSARFVTWKLFGSGQEGSALSILIRYGTDPLGNPEYIGKFVPGTYGSTTIPIIPAPASLLTSPLSSSNEGDAAHETLPPHHCRAGVCRHHAPAALKSTSDLTLNWLEVRTGTNTPVPSPNGIPRARANLRASPSPSSIHATADCFVRSVHTAAPPGTGPCRLGRSYCRLARNRTQHHPRQSVREPGVRSARPAWLLGGGGQPTSQDRRRVIQAGQSFFRHDRQPANPIRNIWQGVWTPTSYSVRNVLWQTFPGVFGGRAVLSILIQYGTDPSGSRNM